MHVIKKSGNSSIHRADSKFAPSQWEMSLQSKDISHWLGMNLHSFASWQWGPGKAFHYNDADLPICWILIKIKRCSRNHLIFMTQPSIYLGKQIEIWVPYWSSFVEKMEFTWKQALNLSYGRSHPSSLLALCQESSSPECLKMARLVNYIIVMQ